MYLLTQCHQFNNILLICMLPVALDCFDDNFNGFLHSSEFAYGQSYAEYVRDTICVGMWIRYLCDESYGLVEKGDTGRVICLHRHHLQSLNVEVSDEQFCCYHFLIISSF